MRRALRVLPLAALLAAVAELAVFVLLGRGVGYGWAVLLVAAASTSGLVLLRREGIRAWRGFQEAVRDGRPPGGRVSDGLVGLAAGLLLALPGLISGALGLMLTLPPLRRLARHWVRTAAERRMSPAAAGSVFGPRRVRVRRGGGSPSASSSGPPPTVPDQVPGQPIEGEIVPPRLP